MKTNRVQVTDRKGWKTRVINLIKKYSYRWITTYVGLRITLIFRALPLLWFLFASNDTQKICSYSLTFLCVLLTIPHGRYHSLHSFRVVQFYLEECLPPVQLVLLLYVIALCHISGLWSVSFSWCSDWISI